MGSERNIETGGDARAPLTPGDGNVVVDGHDNVIQIHSAPPPAGAAVPGAAVPPALHPGPYGLPPLPEGKLLGRDDELRRLHQELRGTETDVALTPARKVSAHGGGGIGKTRLALEYAHRHLTEYPGGVFFVVVGEREPLQAWAELARQLFVRELVDDEAAAAALLGHLKTEGEAVLVILDDVAGDAARFAGQLALGKRRLNALPGSARVSLLMTTRLGSIAGARSWPVERLGRKAAVALLGERAGRRVGDLEAAERAAAGALADEDLGGHALALALAGSYLRKVPSLGVASYREKLHRLGATAVLEEAARHAETTLTDHERSIVATFELSLALLDDGAAEDALARRLLELASFLAPGVAIDRGLLRRLLAADGAEAAVEEVDLAVGRLLEISLLMPERREMDVQVHALVSDYVRWD